MSGLFAGHMPWLPPTPKPGGAGVRVPLRDGVDMVQRLPSRGPRSKGLGHVRVSVEVGAVFGCWRVVELLPNAKGHQTSVLAECVRCGVTRQHVLSMLRGKEPREHQGRKGSWKICKEPRE